MKCPKCGSNCDDYKYCGKCGTALFTKCKKCNKEFLIDNRFCPFCGNDNLKHKSEEHIHKKEIISGVKKQSINFKDNIIVVIIIFIILILLPTICMNATYWKKTFFNYGAKEESSQINKNDQKSNQEKSEDGIFYSPPLRPLWLHHNVSDEKQDEEDVESFVKLGSFGVLLIGDNSEDYFLFIPYKSRWSGNLEYNITVASSTDHFMPTKEKYYNNKNLTDEEFLYDKINYIFSALGRMEYKFEFIPDCSNNKLQKYKYSQTMKGVWTEINKAGNNMIFATIDVGNGIIIDLDKTIVLKR